MHPLFRPHPPDPRRWPLWLLLALPWTALAQQPAPLAASSALACLIQPSRVAEVGSAVIGVVDRMLVDRGDSVRKGQVLVELRADVERANAEAVRARAQSEAEVRGAEAARNLARLRLERARTLKSQDFVSAQAVEQAQAEYEVAHERVAQAHDARRVAARELGVSSAQTNQRVLRSPFDGVVVERYANPGERFEDKPLVKLAVVSPLRVDVVAPTALFGQLQPGQELQVTPELPGAGPRSARILQIDQVLDPASNTFRLRLEMANADRALPAGLRCKVDLGLQRQPGARLPVPGSADR